MLAVIQYQKRVATSTSVYYHRTLLLSALKSTGIPRFTWPIDRAILNCADLAVRGRSA